MRGGVGIPGRRVAPCGWVGAGAGAVGRRHPAIGPYAWGGGSGVLVLHISAFGGDDSRHIQAT